MASKRLYFLIHKPYGILSQFSDEHGNPGLGTLYDLPKDVYPVGRLDKESEGLLILTNDRTLNHEILDPEKKHEKTYWAEVEGIPDENALEALQKGVEISVGSSRQITSPASVQLLANPGLEEREPPVNRKKHPVTHWIELKLIEGKNRQVRKMTAKVGHPTLRLIRVAIEEVSLFPLKPGQITQIAPKPLFKKLKIVQ